MDPSQERIPSDEEKWDILTRPEKLGEILLKHGKITLKQLEDLIKEQEKSGMPFGELVLSKGIMSREDLLKALDWQHKSDQVIIESLTEMVSKQAKETKDQSSD
ncbi:MAG TPA: hypothetical protein V6D17_17550 [Candidatus Obscuribacterales bacterium]